MNTEIIIIDDNISKTDPFVRVLQKTFSQYSVIDPFSKADDGVKYILENLNKKMIVFLDWNFDTGIRGVEALSQIREKTSLLYIIVMSANPLTQFHKDDISKLINSHSVYFIDKNDSPSAIQRVNDVTKFMNSSLDCVLEQWAIKNPDYNSTKPFVYVGEKSYTLQDVLFNIRTRTDFGVMLEKNILSLTIRLLANKDESI